MLRSTSSVRWAIGRRARNSAILSMASAIHPSKLTARFRVHSPAARFCLGGSFARSTYLTLDSHSEEVDGRSSHSGVFHHVLMRWSAFEVCLGAPVPVAPAARIRVSRLSGNNIVRPILPSPPTTDTTSVGQHSDNGKMEGAASAQLFDDLVFSIVPLEDDAIGPAQTADVGSHSRMSHLGYHRYTDRSLSSSICSANTVVASCHSGRSTRALDPSPTPRTSSRPPSTFPDITTRSRMAFMLSSRPGSSIALSRRS